MTGRLLVVGLLTLLVLVSAWLLVAATPLVIVLAAGVPAAAYAVVIIRLDRDRREPLSALMAAFIGGALVAALAASAINDAVGAWTAGTPSDRWVAAVLAAPLLEEVAKAVVLGAVLRIWLAYFDGVLDGMVYGALVGLGFAMTENLGYFTLAAVQGGPGGLARSLYLRGVLQGLIHPVFTAAAGAGFGYARETRSAWVRRLAPVIGLGAAVVQHVVWNGVVSAEVTRLLCAAATADGRCLAVPPPVRLYAAVPAVIGAFLAPSLLILGAMVRRRLRYASRSRGTSSRDQMARAG